MASNVKALLFDRLRESGLLEPGQLEELAQLPEAKDPDPRGLAKQVLRRGWLTRFQLNAVAQGKAAELSVGPYVLLDRLGEGGMGQVFKARHRHMNRVVALKVIRRDRLKSAEAVQRFYQEVQAAAQLSHPNIVLAYDAGQAGTTHYLSMEFVDGHDLAHIVKERGPLPVAQACDYVRQAALGLQHAYERGMVHRDIKPHNLLVAATPAGQGAGGPAWGVVKILDMGLARLQQGLSEQERGLTRTGAVLGTPDFLAPEQALNSRAADVRSDLYSLGCTLYYLLAGHAPFHAESLTQLLLKHQMEHAVPLEQRRPDVPPGVLAIVNALLAKRPEDRIQTPAELAAALQPFCGGDPGTVSHGPALRQPAAANENSWATLIGEAPAAAKAPAGATTVTLADAPARRKDADKGGSKLLLVGLIGGGAFVFLLAVALVGAFLLALVVRPRPGVPPSPGPIVDGGPAPPGRPGLRPPPAVDAPGNPPPPPALPGAVPVVKGERRLLDRDCFPVTCFAFSPDSRRALAVHNQMASVWDVETGQLLARLPPHPSAFHVGCFATDGRKVYLTCYDKDVYAWDVGANLLSRVFRGSDHGQTTWGTCLAVSPDANRLYEGSGDNQRDANAQPVKQGGNNLYQDTLVRIIDVGTGNEVGRFAGHTGPVHTVDVSADGQRVLSASEDAVCLWDARNGKPIRTIAARAFDKGDIWLKSFLAGDGRTALVGGKDPVLHVWDVDNDRELRSFGTPDARLQAVALSPDGTRALTSTHVVEFLNQKPEGKDVYLRLWDVKTGTELRRFEGHTHYLVSPVAISPDNRLAISAGWDHTVRLWDLNAGAPAEAGGAGQPPEKGPEPPAPMPAGARPSRLAGHTGAVTALAGSPDGHRLLSGGADGTVRLWDVDAGKQLVQLNGAQGEVRAVALSPDGRYAAAAGADGMSCWDTMTGEVIPGVSETKPMGGVFFSSDGKRLFVAGTDGTVHSFFMDRKAFDWGMTAPHLGMIRCLAAVPGDQLCVYVPKDDDIHVYDLSARKDVRKLLDKFTSVTAVACAPDGHEVAGVVGTAVEFWDAQTGNRAERFLRHNAKVAGVAYSPDGRYLVTGGQDGIARLWDAKSRERKADFSGHKGPIRSVAFSGKGRFAVTGGEDGVVLLWPVPK